MTKVISPLKGFRSIGVNLPSSNKQDSEEQSIDKNLGKEILSFTEISNEIKRNDSFLSFQEKRICTKCEEENDKSHSFCTYCGGRLDLKEESTPSNNFVVCTTCGNKNPEDAITCHKCGNFLNIVGSLPHDQTVSYENNAPKFDPYIMPPSVGSSFSESQKNQADYTNKKFPSSRTGNFKNAIKNSNKYSIFIIVLGALIFIFSISAINSLPSPFNLYPGEAQIRYYTPLKIYQFLRVIGILITLGGAYLMAHKNFSKSDL